MRINSVKALEDLAYQSWKRLREGYACAVDVPLLAICMNRQSNPQEEVRPTDPTREHRLVVNVSLNPSHQVFNVFRRWHFGWALEVLGILPKVFESNTLSQGLHNSTRGYHSSVAFISGHD